LAALGEYLSAWLEPERGFITRHFSPAGGRMYFTEENAMRIDAARAALHRWHTSGLLDDDGFHLLLAAVLEGADRVANTAGVYAAFIKTWQPNAVRRVTFAPEPPVRGKRSTAHRADAADVARSAGDVDLLYVDPPYNGRQYAGYYHLPEIIARGWFDAEPALRGKTGLLSDTVPRSPWCSRRRAPAALAELLAATRARHVLLSYNSEGILSPEEITESLRAASADATVRRFTTRYRRYRADSDRAGRRYSGDEVRELLYWARLR
ncbi:MAG TPA: DNA adenine methylase, partial [Solirubrobacteraceae bacterium]|nr:DNA adenine methylase [Solirubrobacteraceae bacterium]